MPLQPAEKAMLALWLCAARHLDPECGPVEDPAGFALIIAARGQVEGAAEGSRLAVASAAAIGPYLVSQADHLATLPRGGASAAAIARVRDAERLLRVTAQTVQHDGTGDGFSLAGEASTPCSCGVLALAAAVETRVRQLLAEERSLPFDNGPSIEYVTALGEDDREFAPFCIGGRTSIRRTPRVVEMILRAKPLTSRDLWHIAYTLHHELVCHAFQGAASIGRLTDAHPNCHWSEGWMDTLAFDLVLGWEDAPSDWLQIRGDDARGELWRFHEHRYVAPARLSPDDVKRRRLARDAYRRLAKTLASYQLAASNEEADAIVRRFSLAANAHHQADCVRLKALGTKLRILLLSEARPEAGLAAAAACLAFTANRDFQKLERAIEGVSS